MWTCKRTVIAGRTDGDNDWTVYRDRQPVGRVYVTHISDPVLKPAGLSLLELLGLRAELLISGVFGYLGRIFAYALQFVLLCVGIRMGPTWIGRKPMGKELFKQMTITAAMLGLAGCGATVSNTDKPSGVYLAGAPSVAGDFNVRLVEAAPVSGGKPVSGVSCKNKIWDPAPSNEVAISVMRREAAKAGFDSVYLQEVAPAADALLMNCWAAIEARGLAFDQ